MMRFAVIDTTIQPGTGFSGSAMYVPREYWKTGNIISISSRRGWTAGRIGTVKFDEHGNPVAFWFLNNALGYNGSADPELRRFVDMYPGDVTQSYYWSIAGSTLSVIITVV